MVNKKIKLIVVSFILVISFYGISVKEISAKTDLVIEGNVLGYNLYTIRPSLIDGLTYPTLVEIKKVVEGKEESKFILVLYERLNEDYAEKTFGTDKLLTLSLSRQKFCDNKLKNLLGIEHIVENGKNMETQSFTFVSGIKKESLPLKKKLPCYFAF